ncbi:MAG: squalene/phytoene synthase family protein, partial [Rhodospirillaceae bacterium]|nr:squalene/phytoene synthase family protein [Rhodospirillaceae bacterium]
GTGDPAAVGKALALRASLLETGVPLSHARDLLAAFTQDATKTRYADWPDLMGYCPLSAAPVGRYLLDLFGEDPAGYAASDPLCDALQVLNHLQDLKDDHANLDRVYLPQDWLAEAGESVAGLQAPAASAGLRRVIDRCLDGVDELLARAAGLPPRLNSRRLAMESAVILRLARKLARRLRRGDPIAGRVALSKLDFARAGAAGMLAGWLRR